MFILSKLRARKQAESFRRPEVFLVEPSTIMFRMRDRLISRQRMKGIALSFLLLIGIQNLTPPFAHGSNPFVMARNQEPTLGSVRTLLLLDRVSTWLAMPRPPYNIAITVKLKLERAGYRITLEPEEPHEALLIITYVESPGREYARLEQGTVITCDLELYSPVSPGTNPLLSYHLTAETAWPLPVGSLYWNAVQNLEEDPYYYYLAELFEGYLARREPAGKVFARMLREPPLAIPSQESGQQVTARIAANQGARRRTIHELGRVGGKDAQETLWFLVEQSNFLEQKTALEALGELRDPSSLPRLTELLKSETDPTLKATAEATIAEIQEGR